MKPRIRLDHGVWCCFLPDWQLTRRVGMGYSPKAAYDDWHQLDVFHGEHMHG